MAFKKVAEISIDKLEDRKTVTAILHANGYTVGPGKRKKTPIDERRKKVKEVINQPYAEFEKELKEITDLIKKQSAEIDEQVKAFETAEKEEKRAKIMEAYEKAVGNLAEILPFSKVFDQRYLNKTCKLESAIADVQKKIEQVKTDLETIESVCGKYQQ